MWTASGTRIRVPSAGIHGEVTNKEQEMTFRLWAYPEVSTQDREWAKRISRGLVLALRFLERKGLAVPGLQQMGILMAWPQMVLAGG